MTQSEKPSQLDQNAQAIAERANAYLAAAAQPGQARLYGLAQASLKPLVTQTTSNTEVWLAWAQVQQHQHAFDDALAALDRVFQEEPKHTTANLVAARIHLIQGNPDAARTACLNLLGQADLYTVSACSLEVASYQGKLAESYEQLNQLVDTQGLPADARGPWLVQMLADMATRLDKPLEAINWLDRHLDGADVNYLAQWADAQLAADNPQQVLSHLAPIAAAAPSLDDALILRLAQAEQQVGGNHWQALLSERVALREQRQDRQHASELARYYLELDPKPDKALYWARLNWQSAREHTDKKLLDQAQQAADLKHSRRDEDNQEG